MVKRKSVIRRDFIRNKSVYGMFIPVALFYILFCYKPMVGVLIAFQDFTPGQSMIAGPWVGLYHFVEFFRGPYFTRTLWNTLNISLTNLIFGFPAPIILALLINEIKIKWFARTVQTITYLPHFISLVVICGLIIDFTSSEGLINSILSVFGFESKPLLQEPGLFVPIYVLSDIWQTAGWSSIIYLSALTSIDMSYYEAAEIDGAGKWKQLLHVTIPGIMPTIIIMFILKMGNILNVGFEKIILLYSPVTYETADVISSFVYRKGLEEFNWSFSTAVGLFNSVINLLFIITANWLSKKTTETALW